MEVKPQPWMPEGEYAKLEGQVKLRLNGIMQVFNAYGQSVYIPEAIEAVMQVVRFYGLRLRGVDEIPPEKLIYNPLEDPDDSI
jgi:hypothetical protein